MAQGSQAKFGYGFETEAAGQKAGTLYGMEFAALTFNPDPKVERTRNMRARGQLRKARVTEMNLPWSVDSDPSVDDIARWRAHHQGYAAITNTATGVYTWAMRDLLSTDSMAEDLSYLSLVGERDDDYPVLLLGAKASDMELKVQRGKFAGCKTSGMACNFTHLNDPSFDTDGATYLGTMYVRGNRQDANATDTATEVLVECSTPGALDGTAKIQFSTTGGAFGVVEYPVTAGVWIDAVDGDGNHLSGDPLNPIQVMFTSGGTLSEGDAWSINVQRAETTLTYPTRNPLTGIKLDVTIGGVSYDVENFDLKFTRPRKARRGSGLYPKAILDDGDRSFTIKIMRDYVDTKLYNAMLSSSAAAFTVQINGDKIATVSAVTYFEYWKLHSANAQILKAGADPTGPKHLQESVDIVPFFDGTSVDMAEEVRCTLSSLV